MNDKSYSYLNAAPFDALKVTIVLGAPFFAVSFVLGLKWWLGILIPLLCYGIYLLFRRGQMSIIQKGDLNVLHFKDVTGVHKLIPPLKHTSSWTYEFPKPNANPLGRLGKLIPFTKKKESAPSNTLLVSLHLKDSQDKELLVLERIVMDLRFPNEQPYSISEPNLELDQVVVQRVDKVMEFLMQHFGEEDFKRVEKL